MLISENLFFPIRTHFLRPSTPLQYSCLENPMDGGAWWAAVHRVAKSWTWLSNFPFTFHFHALEKEMATHSSVFTWRIPGTGEPGVLPSVGLHRVEYNWSNLAAAAACKWNPTFQQQKVKKMEEERMEKCRREIPFLGKELFCTWGQRLRRTGYMADSYSEVSTSLSTV